MGRKWKRKSVCVCNWNAFISQRECWWSKTIWLCSLVRIANFVWWNSRHSVIVRLAHEYSETSVIQKNKKIKSDQWCVFHHKNRNYRSIFNSRFYSPGNISLVLCVCVSFYGRFLWFGWKINRLKEMKWFVRGRNIASSLKFAFFEK